MMGIWLIRSYISDLEHAWLLSSSGGEMMSSLTRTGSTKLDETCYQDRGRFSSFVGVMMMVMV